MMQFVIDNEIYSFDYTFLDLLELEIRGIPEKIRKALESQDLEELTSLFAYVILNSYCAKSKEDYNKFKNSKAFAKIFMILATDNKKATAFMQGIIKEATP